MLVEPRAADDPALVALVARQQAEVAVRDGGVDGVVYPLEPGVEYLVGIVDGAIVACGALQPLGGRVAELKRMYVRPEYRRRGLARRMILALEALAAERGHTELRLETGTYLPDAVALYRSQGYRPIDRYGPYIGNPYSICFAKPVVPVDDPHAAGGSVGGCGPAGTG